nr:reverse transcriptase domain-containing protein [Tanacetum cinerariifolium]
MFFLEILGSINSKANGKSLEQKIAKKQRIDKKEEEVKRHLLIVANDDDDAVYIEATPLVSKVPIVDYQIHHENNKPNYKIIRADRTHKLFLNFITLLKNFDKEDLETLWKLVKERFESIEPKNFSDVFLRNILKIMFEKPNVEDNVWRDQKGRYGLAKVKSWKLFESCGVHIITHTTTQMFLLVGKKYPLTHFTLEQMLNNVRLEVEEESDMSLELLRLVRRQLNEGFGVDDVQDFKKCTKGLLLSVEEPIRLPTMGALPCILTGKIGLEVGRPIVDFIPPLWHKVMHAYYAKESPIPPPVIVPLSPMLSPMFNPQEFFLLEELLPPKKRGCDRSSSSTSTLPQEFKIGESSHKKSLELHGDQIEEILNHLDELSLDRIENIEDNIEVLKGKQQCPRKSILSKRQECSPRPERSHGGCQVFIAQAMKKKSDEKGLEDIPVVKEFQEVFLEELPSLPPVHQVEFQIDLISRAAPVARAPYRLVPLEMQELSNQLQELVSEKLFEAPILALQEGNDDFVVYCDASHQERIKHDTMHWLELLADYDYEIRYHPGKVNVVADALSQKERIKPLRVRSLVMTIHPKLPLQILEAQTKAIKEENIKAETYEEWTKHLKYILMELVVLRIKVGYHSLAAPFEALYGRKYRSPVCWAEVGDVQLMRPEIIHETTEKIVKI